MEQSWKYRFNLQKEEEEKARKIETETKREIKNVVTRLLFEEFVRVLDRMPLSRKKYHITYGAIKRHMYLCNYRKWKHFPGKLIVEFPKNFLDNFFDCSSYLSDIRDNLCYYVHKRYNFFTESDRQCGLFINFDKQCRDALSRGPILRDSVTQMIIVNYWKKLSYQPESKAFKRAKENFTNEQSSQNKKAKT